MPFAIEDFHDLVRLLEEHPQWRADLRRLVLSEELLGLPALVQRLAEAQERAEQRLEGVEGRLERVEARLDRVEGRLERVEGRLAGVEVRMDRVEAAIERLTAAQARTDGQVRGLRREVGVLSEGVGARAEVDAQRALVRLLEEKGYRLQGRPRPVAADGEVDVALRAVDAGGETFSVLLEAKFRLQRGDVTGWHRRLREPALLARLAKEGLPPPFLAYAFGLRVYQAAERAGEETGIGVLDTDGELVTPVPRPA